MLQFNYTQNLTFQHLIAQQLLARLFMLPLLPEQILNISRIYDSYINIELIKYYPNANIYNLLYTSNKAYKNDGDNDSWILTDLYNLPFKNNSFDLVIANLCIDRDDQQLNYKLQELHRIMRIDALLLFAVCNTQNIGKNELMHIGDLLLIQQFCDPVIDLELIKVNYHKSLDKKIATHNNMINIEILYGHALGNNLIKTPIAD